jgi:hypothetical protein
MNKSKTLIILDWDDTLFPTSWVVKKNINLNDSETINKYKMYFSELDNILYELLINFLKCGKVVIVTNAMTKWVLLSYNVLPNTKNLIKKNIEIISARDICQDKMSGQMDKWKKLIFKQLVSKYFINSSSEKIVSIGDANYEFNALVDLHDGFKKKRFLKAIKFMDSPSYESLLDQLEVLNSCVNNICTSDKHMDLKFENLN